MNINFIARFTFIFLLFCGCNKALCMYTDPHGKLVKAAFEGDRDEFDKALKEVTSEEINKEYRVRSQSSWTALNWAAHRGDFYMVDELLKAGADATVATSGTLETPLILAASQGSYSHFYSPIDANKKGSEQDYARVAELLIQHGADPDHEDKKGRTPKSLAKSDAIRNMLKKTKQIKKPEPKPKEEKEPVVERPEVSTTLQDTLQELVVQLDNLVLILS